MLKKCRHSFSRPVDYFLLCLRTIKHVKLHIHLSNNQREQAILVPKVETKTGCTFTSQPMEKIQTFAFFIQKIGLGGWGDKGVLMAGCFFLPQTGTDKTQDFHRRIL